MNTDQIHSSTQKLIRNMFVEMIWRDLSHFSVEAAFFWREQGKTIPTEKIETTEQHGLITPLLLLTSEAVITDFGGSMRSPDLAAEQVHEFQQIDRHRIRLPVQIAALLSNKCLVCSVLRPKPPGSCHVALFHSEFPARPNNEILAALKSVSGKIAHFEHIKETAKDAESYRSIFDALPEALIFIPHNATFGFVNHIAADLLCCPSGKVPMSDIAHSMAELRDHAENRDNLVRRHFRQTSNGKVDIDEIWKLPNSAYHVRSILFNDVPQGCVWQFRNISMLYKREEQLIASEKLRLLGMVSGGVSHEFNNIFQTIMAIADDIGTNGNSPNLQRNAETLITLSEKASGITHSLSLFAKNAYLRPGTITVGSGLADIHARLKYLVPVNIDFDLEISPTNQKRKIYLDGGQLELCLARLIQNAVEAIQANSLRILKGAISLSFESSKQEYTIQVRDNGEGMKAETRACATEPFFTTRDARLAVGLGLTEVDGFVRQSGGRFEISSTHGKGTSIRLVFPITDQINE
ncbi:ATP-binding protein [Thalassospira australica]|uniref:ATP-binding protein n=1 Tax=Thalassospira australica TaxID=1528106 RepID=UPI0038505071